MIVPRTSNYLLNPRHPDAARVRIAEIVRYPLGPRLVGERCGNLPSREVLETRPEEPILRVAEWMTF